jgi:hypothetical protein
MDQPQVAVGPSNGPLDDQMQHIQANAEWLATMRLTSGTTSSSMIETWAICGDGACAAFGTPPIVPEGRAAG